MARNPDGVQRNSAPGIARASADIWIGDKISVPEYLQPSCSKTIFPLGGYYDQVPQVRRADQQCNGDAPPGRYTGKGAELGPSRLGLQSQDNFPVSDAYANQSIGVSISASG